MSDENVAVPEEFKASVCRVLAIEGCELNKLMVRLATGYFNKLVESNYQVTARDFFKVISLMDKSGLNPLSGELYPVVNHLGIVRNIATLEGWLSIGQRKDIQNVEFFYSKELMSVERERGVISVHQWIEAKVTNKETSVVMREFMAENFIPRDETWNKPNSRLRYHALVQCYRVLFGLHDLAEPQEVKNNATDAMNQSITNHYTYATNHSSKRVEDAVVEEVHDTEEAINNIGQSVNTESADVLVDKVKAVEGEIEEISIKTETTKVKAESNEDITNEAVEVSPVEVTNLEVSSEMELDLETESNLEAKIVVNEDNVEVRTLSIVNQYIQNIEDGQYGAAVLAKFVRVKIQNPHDKVWAMDKLNALTSRL